jgi:DNA-binding beta-propeller fold protein YncE
MMPPRTVALLLTLAALDGSSIVASTLLVANKSDDTVSLVSVPDGKVRATLPTGSGPHEVATSPDGALAVVSNYGRREGAGSTLTVVDVASAKVQRTVDLGENRRPHGLAWLADGRLLVTTEDSRKLLVVDPGKGAVVA